MSKHPPVAENESFLPDALLAAIDDLDESRSRRAFAWVSVLGLASPESIAPALPLVAARLFDRSVSVARRCDLAVAVASLPAAWTSSLVEHLLFGDDDDRAVAASALAAPRHLEAVHALVRVLADAKASTRVRVACVDALAAIGDASVTSDLVPLFDDNDAQVRHAAVVALRGLDPSRRRAQAFLGACSDVDVDVRCAALAALLIIGGAAACAAARAALSDAAPPARALAVVMLARHGAPKDLARIKKLVDDDDLRVRRAAGEALSSAVA